MSEAKTYPERIPEGTDLDNLALWIFGAGFTDDEMGTYDDIYALRDDLLYEVNQRLIRLQRSLDYFRQKEVKGNLYWYVWENGKWEYLGKKDPRENTLQQIEELNILREKLVLQLEEVIIAQIGEHLIIDMAKLNTLDVQPPENEVLIRLSDITDVVKKEVG